MIKQIKPNSLRILKENPKYCFVEDQQPDYVGNIVNFERVFRKRTIITRQNVMVVDSASDIRAKNYCILNAEYLINSKKQPTIIMTCFGEKVANCLTSSLLKHTYDIVEFDLENPKKSIGINVFKSIFTNYKQALKDNPEYCKYYIDLVCNIAESIYQVDTDNDERCCNFIKAILLAQLEDKKTTVNSFGIDKADDFLKQYLKSKSETYLDKYFNGKSKQCRYLAEFLLGCNAKRRQTLIKSICKALDNFQTKEMRKFDSSQAIHSKFLCEIPTFVYIKLSEDNPAVNAYAPLLLEYLHTEALIGSTKQKCKDVFFMLDHLDRQNAIYDLNFKIDQARINRIKYSATVDNLDNLFKLYGKQTSQLLKNFECKLFVSSNQPDDYQTLTIDVEYKKKIGKFHLNNTTKTKSYTLSLNNLKDGEAILLEDAKEPVLVDIDFYN